MPYYYAQQEIKVGDRVRLGENIFGVVERVLDPGSEAARSYASPDGGIVIRVDGDDNRILIQPYGFDWEDLYFITENPNAAFDSGTDG